MRVILSSSDRTSSHQTAEVLRLLCMELGHEANHIDASSTPPSTVYDLLIDIDARHTAAERARWATTSVVFLRGMLSFTELDEIVYIEETYQPRDLTGIAEVWCWDDLNPAPSLPALSALFPCPIRRVPMIWAPILSESPRSHATRAAPVTIHVMEGNKTNKSTSVLAIVALRELARTKTLPPTTQIRIHNMEHLKDNRFLKENILDNVEWQTLVNDYRAEMPTERIPFTAWPEGSVLLSHTRFSPLRWTLLSVLWWGMPVIHNSPLLRELHPHLRTTYYQGNRITGDESILSATRAYLSSADQWIAVRQEIRDAIQARWGIPARKEEWRSVFSAWEKGPSAPVHSVHSVIAVPQTNTENALRTLRIAFMNMWPGFSANRNYFMDALRHYAPDTEWEGMLYSSANKPDLVIFGPYGEDWKQVPPTIPRVYFSAENWATPTDPSIRLWLTPSREEDDQHLRIPTWAIFIDWFSKATTLPTEDLDSNPIRLPLHFATTPHPVPFSQRTEFCGFVVSNPICTMRNDTFHALHAYKPVNSGGGLFNNIGGQLALKYPGGGCGDISKFHFFERQRFSISFENSQAPGYVTEKLLHAKMAGCVPLYWGDANADTDFTPNSFVNLSKISHPDQVVEAVKRLESRSDLCDQISSMPILSAEKVEKALQIQQTLVRRLQALLAPSPSTALTVPTALTGLTVPIPKIDRVYLVNLDKRRDRMEKLFAAEPYWKDHPQLERISAVDGTTLTLTPFIYEMFKHNTFQWKKSVMGCLLSHIRIWSALLQTQHEYVMILEDDVRFVKDWQTRWITLSSEIPSDADVLYLGGVLPQNKEALPMASESVNASWQRVLPNRFFTPDSPTPIFHFCTFSYVLHRRGAKKLMDFLMQSPLKAFTACDHLLGHPMLGLTHYHAASLLTYCFQEEDPAYVQSNFNELLRKDQFDSDIWNNTECFTEEEVHTIAATTETKPTTPPVETEKEPLLLHTHDVMPELYERQWLEDMLQRPIQLRPVAEMIPTNTTTWFLVQRPHLEAWIKRFTEYEKEGRPFAVLHLSDEFAADDISWYRYKSCKGVIRNYHRDDCPSKPHLLTIPLGYHYKAPSLSQKSIQERDLMWSFHGTDWFQRSEQLRPMVAFVPHSCHLQPTWNHSSGTKEKQYLSTLANSKFCPILRGNNRETFRLYEALEAGTMPITTITDLTYLYHVDKEIGLEELYPWNKPIAILQKPEQVTENIRQEVIKRWGAWKVRVQEGCARILQGSNSL